MPQVESLASLNQQFRERCLADLDQRTRGKPAPKSELLREDQASFLPLPKQPFEARRVADRTADSQSLVRFDDNDYSVPVRYPIGSCSWSPRWRKSGWSMKIVWWPGMPAAGNGNESPSRRRAS